MNTPGSITHWIGQLQAGESVAAQHLWEGYFQKMVKLARLKLAGLPRRAADEEDVALSAFHSFCQGAGDGRFPQLSDRNSLWPLLVSITAHKAIDLLRREHRLKRGGPAQGAAAAAVADWGEVIGREPTPEFVVRVAEEYQRLLDHLGDDVLRSIAVWKMEGYTVEEIAARLGCVPRTIERKLRTIRELWGEEVAP
ncbi:MAG TPA: ECF-type sigma factor [Gemmataceae bacterium]|nr:ECF-type sigma factor [Gemmataceae bacterium]